MTHRRAKVLAATGAVLTVLIAVVDLITLCWCCVHWDRPIRGGMAGVVVGGGRIGVQWIEHVSPPPQTLVGWKIERLEKVRLHWYWWLPHFGNNDHTFQRGWSWPYIDVPLWIPLLMTAAPTAFFVRAARRRGPGSCPKCDYDLTGAPSPTCPECGKPAA